MPAPRASRPRTAPAPSRIRSVCSSRRRAGSQSGFDPPRRRVDVRGAVAYEAADRYAAVRGEVDGEARGGADRDKDRAAGYGGLLNEFERQPAADAKDIVGERQHLLPEGPADDLIHRVVAADVLAHAQRV